jgi:hypothetical protein
VGQANRTAEATGGAQAAVAASGRGPAASLRGEEIGAHLPALFLSSGARAPPSSDLPNPPSPVTRSEARRPPSPDPSPG